MAKEVSKESKFTKEQILASKKLAQNKDLLNAILDPNTTYTIVEAEEKINQYYKRKVN